MSSLGIQWQIESQAVIDYNKLVLPYVLKGINSTGLDLWSRLKADNPGSVRIYRHYPNFHWQENPEKQAMTALGDLMVEMGHLGGVVTHIEDNNEFIHGHSSPQEKAAADLYMSTFMKAAKKLKFGTVFLNAATGNYSGDIVDAFPLSIETALELNAEGGPEIFIGFHEYDAPTMDRLHLEDIAGGGEGYWLCGRWKRAAKAIKAKYGATPRFILTEGGVDFGVLQQHGKGFRSVYPDLDSCVRSYTGDHSLRWIKRLMDEDDDVLGMAIFLISGNFDWADFDIKDTAIPNLISQMPKWEPPEQPNGGNDVIKVYDFDHSPFDGPNTPYRDMDWLRSIFGDIQIHAIESQTELKLGQPKLKVIWFDCRVGGTELIVHVDGEHGNPLPGIKGVLGWPDADEHGLPYNWDLWTGIGAVGDPTNDNGDAGMGSYGKGAYYDAQTERGPHFVWLHTYPSDMVDGLGMLTWHPDVEGNHLHVNIGYQVVVHGEEPPEPIPDDIDAQIISHAESIISLVKSGKIGNIAEVVLRDDDGNEQVFVPKSALRAFAVNIASIFKRQ